MSLTSLNLLIFVLIRFDIQNIAINIAFSFFLKFELNKTEKEKCLRI